MVRRFTFDICDVEDNDNIWQIMANKSSSQHVSIISSEEVGADLFKTGSFSIASGQCECQSSQSEAYKGPQAHLWPNRSNNMNLSN